MGLEFNVETRATIRQRVGSLMGAMHYGTASAGAVGSVTLELAKSKPDNYFQGWIANTVGGTGSGQLRVCTGSTQSTGVITVSPNWGTTPDATTQVELWKPDVTPEQVNNAINLAILGVQHIVFTPVRFSPSAINTGGTSLTFSTANADKLYAFVHETATTDTFIEYELVESLAWLRERPYSCFPFNGKLYLYPAIDTALALTKLHILGYKKIATVSADTSSPNVRSDYLTYMAAFHIEASEVGGPQLDPEEHGGRAANWLREALLLKATLPTRFHPDTVDIQETTI